jgi:hypothetical protein
LKAFLGKAVADLGVVSAVLASIGAQLGLYKALVNGPLPAAELAAKSAMNGPADLTGAYSIQSNRGIWEA